MFSSGRKRWSLSGSSLTTTANQMELTAAIEALKSLDTRSNVTLCSDSQYLIRGMRHLAERWEDQGWRNSRGILIQDRALWQELLSLRTQHVICWRWLRGHCGHPTQTEADALAYVEARRQWCELRLAA